MGHLVAVRNSPSLSIEALGTADIETLEVLRYSKSQRAFEVLYALRPAAPDFTWTATDDIFSEDSIYYVRLRQAGFRDRVAMTWSSPIWVKRIEPRP